MLRLVSLSHISNLGSPKICNRKGEKYIFMQKACKTNIILGAGGKCVCFLQPVLYMQDKIHLGKEGVGCWGSNCNQATALIRGLPQISGWSPVAQLLESGRFYSLLLRMFLFLALSFLCFAALPSSTGGSTQLSLLRSWTGDSGPWNHLSHQQFWCRHVQRAWASSPASLLAKLIPQGFGEL